jgi:Zn-dependent peptidase ImmA (M78 family)
VVAQKYKPEYRRFTMAHEIGHWVLHPAGLHHRDRPLSGGERANRTRPVQEQEADLFAAELTMPRKPLTDYFRQAFGEVVGPTASADLISLMSCGRVNEIDFRQDPRRRAMVVAEATMTGRSGVFGALAKRFGVSGIAMAIQLEDLGLVA